MNGEKVELSQVRLREIIKTEFLVSEDALKQRRIEVVEAALKMYGSVEEFLEKTGWGRDNPECSSEEYLTENRICRWVNGNLIYFSRIIWENIDIGNEGEIHI
ncbi:MAG: hypothetical protein E7244_01395 [Enterocloster citroniae]|nr:hypothetical protein [Enterocloster citroniae]